MSSSEMFEFFDERVALLFVSFTLWSTNGDCAAIIEPVYRDNCIRLLGIYILSILDIVTGVSHRLSRVFLQFQQVCKSLLELQ